MVVALIAGVGLGAVYLFGGGGDATAGDDHGVATSPGPDGITLQGKVAWNHDWPKPNGYNSVTLGSWMVDGAVVVGHPDELAAYDVTNGEQRWTTPLPAGRYLCGMSHTTVKGAGVILLSHDQPDSDVPKCNDVMLVDTADGQPRWTSSLGELGSASEVEISGSSVFAGESGEFYQLPVSDGNLPITDDQAEELQFPGSENNCDPEGLRGTADGKVVYVSACQPGDDGTRQVRVSEFVADTGETQWISEPITLKSTELRLDVVSTEPLVLRALADSGGRLFNLDDNGKLMSTIGYKGVKDFRVFTDNLDYGDAVRTQALDYDAWAGDLMKSPILATDDVVFMRTDFPQGNPMGDPAAISAYDRQTGKRLWKTDLPHELATMFAGMDKAGPIVLSKGTVPGHDTDASAPRLYHLAAEDGHLEQWGKPYEELTPKGKNVWGWMQVKARWTGKSLVLVDLAIDSVTAQDRRSVYALR